MRPVLVTGATGRVGRGVVDLLLGAGVPVRALTHRPEAAATLPADVEGRPRVRVHGRTDVTGVTAVRRVRPQTRPSRLSA